MVAHVRFFDETFAAGRREVGAVRVPRSRLTVAGLIRARVLAELALRLDGRAPVLGVDADGPERRLNPPAPPLDVEAEVARALAAFEQKRVFVIVGERQAELLEEEVDLAGNVDVTFLRLVPLVGG